MDYDFKGLGIDLTNIKDFEVALANYKKDLKADAKSTVDSNRATATDATNELIANNALVKGTKVVVIYNHNEVVGELKTTPSSDVKNLAVISDEFANKDKFAYIPKYNFVRIA